MAQPAFTQLALTDTLFSTSPGTDFWIASAAPADCDGDGDQDLLVAGYYVVYFGGVEDRLTLYRNDGPAAPGTWALTPVPVDATGLNFSAGDVAWGDYDNDGDPDAVVAGRMATTLYRNDGGTLTRTSTALPGYEEDPDFLTMDQHSLSWADFDNDGDLDLLVPSVWENFAPAPTRLLRNDGPGTGGAWTFSDTGQVLPLAGNVATAWADMDADGDLDLMFGNMGQYEPPILDIYRNDGGVLVRADTALARIVHGTAAWGDADADGDFDLVVAGNLIRPDETGETVVRILLRNQSGWTPLDVVREFQSPEEPWLDFEGVTWADYDSDGDIDLLITGQQLGEGEIVGRSQVYVNNSGVFASAGTPLPAPNFGNTGGAFSWFDIDGDHDLDYFQAGGYYMPGGNGLIESRGLLFRNDAMSANAAPSAPTNLQASPAPGSAVTLSWTASQDDGTPQVSLTYDLVLSPSGGAPASADGIPEPGNISGNTVWTLHGLQSGSYMWQVRAVDSAFNASPMALGTFTVGPVDAPESRPSMFAFSLAAAGANPGGGQVVLSIDRPQHVTLTAFDAAGRCAEVLYNGPLAAGRFPLALSGTRLPNGVYFLRAVGEAASAVHRVTLLR